MRHRHDQTTFGAASGKAADLQWLEAAIRHAAHLLPSQGPIDVFIHHNTLHAFEHLPFDEALRVGSRVFGCEPYLTEDRYRDELTRGRIVLAELHSVLERDLGAAASEMVRGLSSRFDLRLAMLQHPLPSGEGIELDWFMTETDALRTIRRDVSEVQRRRLITETRHWAMRRLRGTARTGGPPWIDRLFRTFREARIERWSDAQWESFTVTVLWEICTDGARLAGPRRDEAKPMVRPRDLLEAVAGVDSDLLVHDVLIRFCAAFLDQGIGHWTLPDRNQGFYKSFLALYGRPRAASAWWLTGLRAEIDRLTRDGVGPLECLRESLDALGVARDDVDAFLSDTLLALRGWAGMLWHVEERADRVHHPVPEGSLVEYLAVRLLLERHALTAVARESLGHYGPLSELSGVLRLRTPPAPETDKQRAFLVFQLAQVLGWTPERLARLDAPGWTEVFDEIERFDGLSRRRLFHLAYEHRLRVQTLDALATRPPADAPKARPSFQAIFCIDEREESIRRHVEEVTPTAETFGTAGFFGVVMYYRGAAAADFVPLCPVVVRPKHWVAETVDYDLLAELERRRSVRRRVGMTLQAFHGGSRRIVSGAFYSATVGLLATIPLVARVLFPRLTARLQWFFGRLILPPPRTRLNLERKTDATSPAETEQGFQVGEMIEIGERVLRDVGLTTGFARLVFLVGHGSTSMNNPHESAHDCGACGGGAGGPNARAAAWMLNDPRVRQGLAGRGILIPDDVVFIGGLHNTSTDDLTWSDLDRLPVTHRFEYEAARAALDEAAVRNAHERTRRFGSAPLGLTPPAAKRHVEGRAEDLSQVRPEWGHATNAVCIVGRRRITRGLFLDRRPFLVSYDPEQDDANHSILARILGAVVPVCSGINLEYYFCYVDSPGWGSGSKLPHNITGLLGVMDGAQSDLRTGLPWQMVEIHEPVRLLFVIESTPEALLSILERNAGVNSIVRNGWVQLALKEPRTGRISLYQDGRFEPYEPDDRPLPVSSTSREWYAGWREPLDFAEVAG